MEQLKAFIKKANGDKELMAKLDALGASNAETEEIITVAAEYGFTFTKEDYDNFIAETQKSGVLKEEELETATGGVFAGTDRFDPNVCPYLTRTRFECVGFLSMFNCTHYVSEVMRHLGDNHWHHRCKQGAFNYIGTSCGIPK